MSDRLQKLEERKAKIAAEIGRIRGREAAQARKDDTRRKILAGALFLRMMDRGEVDNKNALRAALDKSLARPEDRALFNLPPLPPQPPERG